MSIEELVSKLPIQDKRRGILVAIEGPPLSGKTHLIEKIKDTLGKFEVLSISGSLKRQNHAIDHDTAFRTLAELHVLTKNVKEDLYNGKNIMIDDYVMGWIARAYLGNIHDCKNKTFTRGIGCLLPLIRNLPVADVTLYLEPNTGLLVSRALQNGDIKEENDFVFSPLKKLYTVYGSIYPLMEIESIARLCSDEITKESDAIRHVALTAAIDLHQRPVRFY